MDAQDVIISALAAGAAACRQENAPPRIVSANKLLRSVVVRRLRNRHTLIDEAGSSPQGHARLAEALRETGASTDPSCISAARALLKLLHTPDGNLVTGEPGPISALGGGPVPERPRIRARPAYQPSSAEGWPAPAAVPHGQAAASPGTTADGSQGRRAGQAGGRRDNPHPIPRRVVLIDYCNGIQVGEDNEQLSVFTVTLSAEFASAQELAEILLGAGTPWEQDIFRHDAELRPPALQTAAGSDSGSIALGPGGDTLVIVRNSRGVQIGNHNDQHNHFRIVAAPVSVHVKGVLLTSARQKAVCQLLENLADTKAAQRLAADLASAAQDFLMADITAHLYRGIAAPRTFRYPGEVTSVSGGQVTDSPNASVRVEVEVNTFDASALVGQIQQTARDILLSVSDPDATQHPGPNLSALDTQPPPLSAI